MICFIQCTNGLINICQTDRAERVLWSLRKNCIDPRGKFILLGKFTGKKTDLIDIYMTFEDLHSHREWYQSDPKLLKFIENICDSS